MKSGSMIPADYLRASSIGLIGACERFGNLGDIRDGCFYLPAAL
jgi:hypothetical protein